MERRKRTVGDNTFRLRYPLGLLRRRYFYESGGMILNSSQTTESGTWLENITLEDNIISRVARSVIFMTAMWAKRPGLRWGVNKYSSDDEGWFRSRNITVRGNNISYPGGDGIVVIAAVDSLIENNVCTHANFLGRQNTANTGIWVHSSKNVTIQGNEATYTELTNGVDGEGLMSISVAVISHSHIT